MEGLPIDKVSQELSQANRNNGYLLQILNKGMESGGFNFSDNENVVAIRTLTHSICDLSSFFLHNCANTSKSPPFKSIECGASETSPLTNSVHNSDVTSCDRVAYEPSSSRWVSEFGEGVMEQSRPTAPVINSLSDTSEHSLQTEDRTKKRKSVDGDEYKFLHDGRIQKSRNCNDLDAMTTVGQVIEYLTIRGDDSCSYSGKKYVSLGLSEMVENLIECCHIDSCPYHEQSLVIFEHTSQEVVSSDSSKLSQNSATTTNSSKLSLTNYFDYCNVIRMVVIERPRDKFQLYVSEDLGEQFHFSCPTASVPRLYHSIKAKNFKDLKLLFIPRTCEEYVSEKLFVCNHWNNQPKNITNHEYLSKVIESSAVNTTSSKKSNAMKRSNKSVSIALQTMYSHQQHKARYCMLPHSVPFVPTIKNHCVEVRGSIISAYSFCCEVLSSSAASNDGKHPFSTDMMGGSTDEEKRVRLSLRSDLLKKLLRDDLDENVNPDIMFEACTMQQTGMLGFHRDTMNCPYLDKTIALHVPDSNNCDSCLSFLYYSRKCVGDYAQKRKAINTFINNPESCPLTVLCLKSLLEVDGIFNYQGLLFENEECLNDLAERYEKSSKHSCAEVSSFTGLSCFKHGAAFDKMGYYSIFVDVYLTLFYLKLVSNDDDSISLCIYFGLLCNGTSNLAATLKDVYNNIDFAQEWCSKKKDRTRLFRLLVILEKRRRSKDSRSDMYGSCKLPRFQYANYSSSVIEEADMVHCYVKDFLMQHSTSSKTDKRINSQHAELYKTLSSIKGIGPLSFNQFWHSLCLCGLLPMDCVQATAVAAGSGPAKLIQTYYPGCKSPEALLSKLHEVKSAINSLGINRISDFFLENMMCELWRLGSKSKLATKSMKPEERKIGFLSDEFHRALVDSAPTKNPDIYYLNPFTDEYQHLFRVVDKQLTMRPSFLPNNNGSSSVVRCVISHCTETGETTVEWSGDFFRRGERSARECFV